MRAFRRGAQAQSATTARAEGAAARPRPEGGGGLGIGAGSAGRTSAVRGPRIARDLFEGIAGAYDMPAALLSAGQYGRWRRFAVGRLRLSREATVLDVATGTGLIARDVARRHGARVVGLDLTSAMLARAREHGRAAALVAGRAERLPFPDQCFDAACFSYLLRYVDDPEATVREMVRVVRPGGQIVSVEFGVPDGRLWRALWRIYALRVFPALTAAVSPGWRTVGHFLGPSIEAFAERFPPAELKALWRRAGVRDVRTKHMTLGAGVVTWGWRHVPGP